MYTNQAPSIKKMSRMVDYSFGGFGECSISCRSKIHGTLVNSAIVRGTELEATAFMKQLCPRFCYLSDHMGKTALHVAASCGKRKLVNWLLANGASINCRDLESGYTPLHRSFFYGRIDVALDLIKAGANVSSLDFDALTPIDHIMKDRPKIVEFSSTLPTQVYVWGSNTNYNLGQATQQIRKNPEHLDTFQHQNGQYVIRVSMNKFHTLFLTNDGHVYACGHGHGGRTGLESNDPIIKPRLIKTLNNYGNVMDISAGADHSLFLMDTGQVLSCGSNIYNQLGYQQSGCSASPRPITWPKSCRTELAIGVAAAGYHSAVWTRDKLFTFGLNGGQLGHFHNEREKTVSTPRQVTAVVLSKGKFGGVACQFLCLGVSDGATVVGTSAGDIFVLHQYQTRKVASNLINLRQVACVGGQLNVGIQSGLKEAGGSELHIAALVQEEVGRLYLWTEASPQLSRCSFTLSRTLDVSHFCLHRFGLAIVTREGETFGGIVVASPIPTLLEGSKGSPQKFEIHGSIAGSSSGIKTWNLEHNTPSYVIPGLKTDRIGVSRLTSRTCGRFIVRLTRLSGLYRSLSVVSDPKGGNFCVLQNDARSFILECADVSSSERQSQYGSLLNGSAEGDGIHDVVVLAGDCRFPAHSYILACAGEFFDHALIASTNSNCGEYNPAKEIIVNDVQPEVFYELLSMSYTGSCNLTICGRSNFKMVLKVDSKKFCDKNDKAEIYSYNNKTSAHSVYKREQVQPQTPDRVSKEMKSLSHQISAEVDPVRIAQKAARQLGMMQIEKELGKYKMKDGFIELQKFNNNTSSNDVFLQFRRDRFPELWDVFLTSSDGEKLGAHKCILAGRSEYFMAMLGSNWLEFSKCPNQGASNVCCLSLPIPSQTLSLVLDYLYEDESQILSRCGDLDFLCDILVVSDQLLLPRLRELCEEALTSLITLRNAADLLQFAHNFHADQLRLTVIQFICFNLEPLIENGTLPGLSREVLSDLTNYYHSFIPHMSCRFMTPFDVPPSAMELEQTLAEFPMTFPESDDTDVEICSESRPFGAFSGIYRKKRMRRSSHGEARIRQASTSSQHSFDGDKSLEEDFGMLCFDNLEEREPNKAGTTGGDVSWQKVSTKKKLSAFASPVLGPVLPYIPGLTSSPVEIPQSVPKEAASYSSPEKLKSATKVSKSVAVHPKVASVKSKPTSFPSLSDSFPILKTTHKELLSGKMNKLSQKQRKKMATDATALKPLTAGLTDVSESTLPRAFVWGQQLGQDTILSRKSGQSLCQIMQEESTSNSLVTPGNDASKGAIAKIKKISKEPKDTLSPTEELSPRSWCNHDGPLTDVSMLLSNSSSATSPPASSVSFCSIVREEHTHLQNLLKESHKPLALIQMEEKAIEELMSFYSAINNREERITVVRVKTDVASPTWIKGGVKGAGPR